MADAPPEPISLAEAQEHLRTAAGVDETIIQGAIAAARAHAEAMIGLILTKRRVTQGVAGFGRWIDLNAWPIADDAVVTLTYLDTDGVTQTVPTSAWRARRGVRPLRLLPAVSGWGVSGALSIDMVLPVSVAVDAGYAPDDVPPDIKQAMLILLNWFYDGQDTRDAAATLLRPHKAYRV